MNLYTYVANSPLKYTDRNGKEKILIMYSPNHTGEGWHTEKFADTIEQEMNKKYK